MRGECLCSKKWRESSVDRGRLGQRRICASFEDASVEEDVAIVDEFRVQRTSGDVRLCDEDLQCARSERRLLLPNVVRQGFGLLVVIHVQ